MKEFGQFHDGLLDGILLDQKDAQIFLSTDEKQSFVFVANGVDALLVDGFRAGNIILDVLLRSSEELTIQDITDLYCLACGATEVDVARELLVKAQERKLVILEINPSYGASCLVLAESIELMPRDK